MSRMLSGSEEEIFYDAREYFELEDAMESQESRVAGSQLQGLIDYAKSVSLSQSASPEMLRFFGMFLMY